MLNSDWLPSLTGSGICSDWSMMWCSLSLASLEQGLPLCCRKVPLFGLEAIWRNDRVVGHIRRADFGHAINKTIAYGYIRDPDGGLVSSMTLVCFWGALRRGHPQGAVLLTAPFLIWIGKDELPRNRGLDLSHFLCLDRQCHHWQSPTSPPPHESRGSPRDLGLGSVQGDDTGLNPVWGVGTAMSCFCVPTLDPPRERAAAGVSVQNTPDHQAAPGKGQPFACILLFG